MTTAVLPGAPHEPRRSTPSWNDTLLVFMKWCQGRVNLNKNLSIIAAHFGADYAGLSRWDEETRCLRTAGFAGNLRTRHASITDHAFADAVCGDWTGQLKEGAAVLHSELLDGRQVGDARLSQWLHHKNIRDIGVLCVAADGRKRDLIELHFQTRPTPHWSTICSLQGPFFADVYVGRRQGLMLETLLQGGRTASRPDRDATQAAILSSSNPAGLTRCEWGICALIANGLSRDGIADELGVKPSTVQTHLRNIYAKTGRERFHALALQLVSPKERAHLALVQGAAAA